MRQSVEAMHEATETMKRGYSMVIFPEGTRGRGGPVKEFKAGSFKIGIKAGVPIVPVTIDGTWHLYEETGRINGARIKLTVHPPIATAGLSREESAALSGTVQKTVLSALGPEALAAEKDL
jgi:1-acyl-sn-glycerol-3-phosphate acyltransferase